jgi:glycerol kinase
MSIVISIDAGTTGVRALAVDERGRPAGWSYREFPQYFPQPGWVEHDPDEIWDAVRATLAELVPMLDQPVATVGITDQRETAVAWDRRTGRPRHRAIVWQDRRTAERCEALQRQGHLPLVRERTGLVLDPYFTATKLHWLIDQGGVEADDHLAVGTIDSWLVWKLTDGAVHATDTTNASRTLLFDLRTLAWSDELIELFEVPGHALPRIVPSSGRIGVTGDSTALGAGVPISGIAGDQQAALFGQACVRPGMTKNTYGTGSFVLMNVGDRCPDPVDGLLTTVAWTIPGQSGDHVTHYALEGAIFVTGAAVQWLRDGLGIIGSADELEALALQCDSTDGVVFVPAFTGLGSPWWDPHARGTILGITRGTGGPHLARAVIEAMVHQTRDVVDAMTAASGHRVESLRADGGASAMDLMLQLQADQLGVPVARARNQETTALGAAYLAGLAEGVWSSPSEIEAQWDADLECSPGGERSELDAAHEQWLRAVERARGWSADS